MKHMKIGGKKATGKPHIRMRKMSTIGKSAYGAVGAPQAFPDPAGGAPFDPSQGGGAPMAGPAPAGPSPMPAGPMAGAAPGM